MRPPAIVLGLGILLAGLAGTLALELRAALSPPRDSAAPPIRPAEAAPAAGSAEEVPTARWVARILGRPLFNPGRRPDAVAAATDAGPGALQRLSGVVMSPQGKAAIFAGPAGGKPTVVSEGARMGAYVIGTIDAGGVTVLGPDGTHVLHPVFASAGRPELPAAQAARPAVPK